MVIIEADARPALQFTGNAGNIALIQFGDNAAVASGQLYYDHGQDLLRVDCGGNADRLTVDADGNAAIDGSLLIKEKASAVADVAGKGQLWTKNVTPCELYFTTDAGDDIQLTSGTSAAGGGGAAADDVNTILHMSTFA